MELLEIAKLPTAENSAIHLHPPDNVAIARVPLSAGTANCRSMAYAVDGARSDPGRPQNRARDAFRRGEMVRRYGQAIGRAKQDDRARPPRAHAQPGVRGTALRLRIPDRRNSLPARRRTCPLFCGYPREDGRAGTRNYIAVVAASNCAAHTAELIARSFDGERLPPNVDGVVAFPHGEGCGHTIGPDTEQLRRTLAGVLAHPNVSAAVILGLGCEVNQIDHYLGPMRRAPAAWWG